MRHTVRPFIKEFKRRSPKSSAPQPPINRADTDSAKPAFLDLSSFAAYENNRDDEYQAALKAADTVFGGNSSPAHVHEDASPSKDPVGRVLPSLIDQNDALADRLARAEEKARRRRKKTAEPESFTSIRRNKPSQAPKSEVTQASAERPVDSLATEISHVSEPRRERSSIQKRWVLKSELKAGQKWKRRLCKAARR